MSSRTRSHVRAGMGLLLALVMAAPVPAVAQEPAASPTSSTSPASPATPASPVPAVFPGVSPMPSAAAGAGGQVVSRFLAPAWTRLRVRGSPSPREDHTWTVDAEGAAAYLFGGRDGATVFDDLWRFDLATDTWSRLRPAGARPSARFGHNATWVPGSGLVVFAGQRGTDFFGDLWAFDPESRRWSRLPARGAAPAPRYGACAVVSWDGRLVISHGFTFRGRFDDTRAYDFLTRRWASVAPEGRRPGERCLHECFTDDQGQLVLYGGQDDRNASLGDLWSIGPDGSWTRQADPRAPARRLPAVTEAGPETWIFGGAGRDGSALDDLWRVDRATLAFTRVRPAGGAPAARWAGTLVTDVARGRILLFGGMRRSALGDTWQLTDSVATTQDAAASPVASPGPSGHAAAPAPSG